MLYVKEKGNAPLNKLFDKIPEDLFSPLSRKYKSIYAFALVALYHLLKTEKTDIRKTDYVNLLKSKGDELFSLFSISADELDDKDDEEKVKMSLVAKSDDKDALLSEKVNYIVRKLSLCGWFIVSKNPKTNVEYIYLPAYSIEFMKILDEMTSDTSSYLPLVHQTYAELKMEDEKEDDYMYRSLCNARNNAENLSLSVTLLKQQICVFGNKLTNVLDPNLALKQHFDEYRTDVSDKYYHPMKTYDSLGLYAQPTITILSRWLHSERILTLLVREAKSEPANRNRSEADLSMEIIKSLQDISDIFSSLSHAFNDIDKANADYTEAVQRKVNYLSSSDKTIKGKIDKIILSLASEIKNNPALDYNDMPLLSKASGSISFLRQGFLDSDSLTMPFKRAPMEESEPLPLDDAFEDEEAGMAMAERFDRDLERFSDQAIVRFIEKNMQGRDTALTTDITLNSTDDLVLYILAILKSLMGLVPFKAEELKPSIVYQGWEMPLYQFTRKGTRKA